MVDRNAVALRIRGRVQGVAFRESTRREAERLGVFGFVRNEVDGSVFAHVEGDVAAVEALVAWCRRGPALARVDAVDEEPAEVAGHQRFWVERR
ncbi:MAG: acylphosphatase [Planctomycetota bacterium]